VVDALVPSFGQSGALVGSWQTLLRLHLPVHTMVGVPTHLPADPAIPAAKVPAPLPTPVGADA